MHNLRSFKIFTFFFFFFYNFQEINLVQMQSQSLIIPKLDINYAEMLGKKNKKYCPFFSSQIEPSYLLKG